MSSTEIDRYDHQLYHLPAMVAPDRLASESLIPQMRHQLAALRDSFGSVITLTNRGEKKGAFDEQEDGPYEMNTWGPLFKDALSKLDPAHAGAEDLIRVIDGSIEAVIAALTLRSNEGIKQAEASAGWARFFREDQRWAARWSEEGTKREYMLGNRNTGLVGGYVEIAPRGGQEEISRLALGEMDLDANGEFALQSGAMIDVRNQPHRTYKGCFVMDGQERTWEDRYKVYRD